MSFLTGLFGGSENTVVTVLLSLGIVLVLIVLGVWALKLIGQATRQAGRGRNRRLALIETTAIDTRRQLVLVRRDDVEHLILIGGPQDVVVESGVPATPIAPMRPARHKTEPASAPARPAKAPPVTAPAPSARPLTTRRPRPLAATASHIDTEPAPVPPLRHTALLRPAASAEIPTGAHKAEPTFSDSAKTAGGGAFEAAHPGGEDDRGEVDEDIGEHERDRGAAR